MVFTLSYVKVQMLFEGRIKNKPKWGKKATSWYINMPTYRLPYF
jgi:hypothetical protein